jgi:hypothetical protein
MHNLDSENLALVSDRAGIIHFIDISGVRNFILQLISNYWGRKVQPSNKFLTVDSKQLSEASISTRMMEKSSFALTTREQLLSIR